MTIMDWLENAEYNLGSPYPNSKLMASEQLRNAIFLLAQGYSVDTNVDELLTIYGSVDSIPPRGEELQSPFICISLSALDMLISAGDPPYVLTVYAHIIRQARCNGMCWESISHMAKILNIATGSTKRALSNLLDHGLITRESRTGDTSIYRLNNPVHNTVEVDHNNEEDITTISDWLRDAERGFSSPLLSTRLAGMTHYIFANNLLGKGYTLDTNVDELLTMYGSVDSIPSKQEHDAQC